VSSSARLGEGPGLSELVQAIFPEIVRYASPEAARGLMVAAGSVYYAFHPRERQRIEESVSDLLGPGERAEKAKRKVFAHILEHYFEKLLVANRPRLFMEAFLRERVEARGLDALDAALARGRGALAVTAHWGAVELIPPFLAGRGYPVSIVLEARTTRLREALERLVVGRDVELIIASRGDRVLERIFGALARGRVLVTQVDEVDSWRLRPSRTIRLFGKALFFDHSLDFITKRSGAASVGIFCRRSGGLRYQLDCEPIALDPGVEEVAAKAMRLWERRTIEEPEQWYQWKKWGAMKAEA
jgi:Kdo2-lipid IVA lauroyltransferase/acyltransferase